MEDFIYDVLSLDSWWWSVGRRALVKSMVHRYAGNSTNQIVLDIGCGTGATMKDLEAYGTVLGLDISPLALSHCRDRGIDTVCAGDAANLPFHDERFDVVVSIDVLEHLDDDIGALREIYRVCRRGGVVIFTVPAFQFLWSRRDEMAHHLRRYRLPEVEVKAKEAGLRIERATYINLPLLIPLFLMVKVGYLLRRSPTTEMDYVLVPPPVNKLLGWVVQGEARWLARADLPIGTSIACVATK